MALPSRPQRNGPQALGAFATGSVQDDLGLDSSVADASVHSSPLRITWAMRHRDDYPSAAPDDDAMHSLVRGMGARLQPSGVVYPKEHRDVERFQGPISESAQGGFRICVSDGLAQSIVQDVGLQDATRSMTRERIRETPLIAIDHEYYRMKEEEPRPAAPRSYVLGGPALPEGAGADIPALHDRAVRRGVLYRGSWAAAETRRSMSRRAVALAIVCVRACVGSWSPTPPSSAMCSSEADLFALSLAAAEGLLLATFQSEQKIVCPPPVVYTVAG